MKKIIDRIMRNPIMFEISSLFIYAFYCGVFGVAAIPAALLIKRSVPFLLGGFWFFCLFIVLCFVAFYLFFICGAVVLGITERLLTLGFKPGKYLPNSPTFVRWLTYAGLHLWTVNLILPFIQGNNWIKIYLRLAGAKIGKEVFVNSKRFYDPYLLTIKDNVLIGGEAVLNCHLFEGGHLVLGEIVVESGTSIGANSYLTPGTHTGKNCATGIYTNLRRNTTMNDGEVLISVPGMTLRQYAKIVRTE